MAVPLDPGPLLLVDGRPVAPAEIAATAAARARGLLGRRGLAGSLVLPRTRSVHTIGMRFPIDAAACDRAGRVLAVRHLPPGRLLLPARGVRWIVEAEAGAFEAWGVRPGSVLRVSSPRCGPPGRR